MGFLLDRGADGDSEVVAAARLKTWRVRHPAHKLYTFVAYINTMKTTFDLNFDLYQALKQHGYTYTWKQREVVD